MRAIPVKTKKGAHGVEAVIYRACRECGAANPRGQLHCPVCDALTPAPEKLGLVAYWHPNVLRRVMFRIGRFFGRRYEWLQRSSTKS